jgi:hypothetical protein
MTVLITLLQSLASFGSLSSSKTEIHMMTNMSIVFRYLRSKRFKMEFIGPIDIVQGNARLTLGLIWSLIVFFVSKDIEQVCIVSISYACLVFICDARAGYRHNFVEGYGTGVGEEAYCALPRNSN